MNFHIWAWLEGPPRPKTAGNILVFYTPLLIAFFALALVYAMLAWKKRRSPFWLDAFLSMIIAWALDSFPLVGLFFDVRGSLFGLYWLTDPLFWVILLGTFCVSWSLIRFFAARKYRMASELGVAFGSSLGFVLLEIFFVPPII
jgi:hypothetical protein